jgi:hypothetical protein
MSIINEKSNEIFNSLKKYIEQAYIKKKNEEVLIKKSVVDNKYPLVVFETSSNRTESMSQDKHRLDEVRNLSFEISIFAINIDTIDSTTICDELADLVCEVMSYYYGMQGGIDAKLKNINTAKATKYILHFSCKWSVRQNMIF